VLANVELPVVPGQLRVEIPGVNDFDAEILAVRVEVEVEVLVAKPLDRGRDLPGGEVDVESFGRGAVGEKPGSGSPRATQR
jgi:hypothetical protein